MFFVKSSWVKVTEELPSWLNSIPTRARDVPMDLQSRETHPQTIHRLGHNIGPAAIRDIVNTCGNGPTAPPAFLKTK